MRSREQVQHPSEGTVPHSYIQEGRAVYGRRSFCDAGWFRMRKENGRPRIAIHGPSET